MKTLLVADTIVDPIVRFLANGTGSSPLEVSVAPYNQVTQILLDESHPVWNINPELLILWTTPARLIASFSELMNFEQTNPEQILREVDAFSEQVRRVANRVKLLFLVSWSVPPHVRWVQTLTMKPGLGMMNILMRMNLRLADNLADLKHVFILDSMYWYASIQKPSFDAKMFALGKINYSRDYFIKAASEIKAIIQGVLGKSKKLIICDLDNTLWSGVIGDDGMDHVVLGGVDPIGESFAEFQKALKILSSRGILLAISSKNDEATALKMINEHPEMILRQDDFVAWRINWDDKASNIVEIVNELNIGLDSVVFLDDNPTERERIKQALPEVFTPDLPEDITQYASFLSSLHCFETTDITEEDRVRTSLYKTEAARKTRILVPSGIEDWLYSLNIELTMSKLSNENLTRVVQLMNKTNQFNLSTRRLNEEEFIRWLNGQGRQCLVYRVKDKFGDMGLTSFVTIELQSCSSARIVDFVMSCRIMGKQIEDAILYTVIAELLANGVQDIIALYRKTPKNKPFADFIIPKLKAESSGTIDPSKLCKPNHIKIHVQGD